MGTVADVLSCWNLDRATLRACAARQEGGGCRLALASLRWVLVLVPPQCDGAYPWQCWQPGYFGVTGANPWCTSAGVLAQARAQHLLWMATAVQVPHWARPQVRQRRGHRQALAWRAA